MAQIRKINENNLDRLLKELTVRGEEIRSLQDEKQSVMDEFRKERERFRNGQISEQSLMTSVKKVTAELAALDLKIRRSIKDSQANAKKAHIYIETQIPEKYRATHQGIVRVAVKKKKRHASKKRKIRTARKAAKARRHVRRRSRKSARARPRRRSARRRKR